MGGWAERLLGGDPYVVQLDFFNGPMDLLLRLIQRRELDITVVSLAAVTDQYIGYLETLAEPDPDQLADFLVVAARLLSIKATVLLGRPQQGDDDSDCSEGRELVRALEEYRLFQPVAAQLRSWQEHHRTCFTRDAPAALPDAREGIPDGLTLDVLKAALRRRLGATPPQPDPPTPRPRTYTVAEKIAHVERALDEQGCVAFDVLLGSAAGRLETIVTFLAILELIKARRVAVAQRAVFGDIVITRAEPPPRLLSEHAREMLVAV